MLNLKQLIKWAVFGYVINAYVDFIISGLDVDVELLKIFSILSSRYDRWDSTDCWFFKLLLFLLIGGVSERRRIEWIGLSVEFFKIGVFSTCSCFKVVVVGSIYYVKINLYILKCSIKWLDFN